MFSQKKYEEQIDDLQQQIDRLKAQLSQKQTIIEESIQILRSQVAQMAQGQTVDSEAILQGSPYATISAHELDAYLTDHPEAILLDVRTDGEWNMGHIDGAMHIEVSQLEARLGQIPNTSKTIVAICARGGRSAAACEVLFRHGYTHLVNVQGGMMDYPGAVASAEIEPMSIEGLEGDPELLQKVARFFDQKVRPALKRDGGDLRLHGISNNIVQVSMVGACGGCGSRSSTVNEGIRRALMAEIPEIEGIQDV